MSTTTQTIAKIGAVSWAESDSTISLSLTKIATNQGWLFSLPRSQFGSKLPVIGEEIIIGWVNHSKKNQPKDIAYLQYHGYNIIGWIYVGQWNVDGLY